MHDCPECGQACGCSGDIEDHDTGEEFYEDCCHPCGPDLDGLDYDYCDRTVVVDGKKFGCVKHLGHDGPCML